MPLPSLYQQIRRGLINVVFKGYSPSSPEIRFWAKVDKEGPIHPVLGTRCWIRSSESITVVYVKLQAYRYSWEIHNGSIPDGLFVCHHCDNRKCVRPDHLFLGTQIDNMSDCCQKGRQAKGEGVAGVRLTEEQVLEIRRRYEPRSRRNGCRALAREFKVSDGLISYIVNNKIWKHLL